MDYSASVLLPWHAASIPRVPEWLAPFRGRPRTDGWVDWRVGGLMYGSRNTLRRPFTSSRSAINSDRVAWRSARCTDSQGRGDAPCILRLRRWGAPSQKAYAMTVNHIPCLPPPREKPPPSGGARLLAFREGSGVRAGCSDADTNLFLIRRAWATQSESA